MNVGPVRYWYRGLGVKRFAWFLPLLLLTCGWAATIEGCSLPAISPAQRAYSLVAGVNEVSRDVLAEDFLPGIADYAMLRDPLQYPGFWESSFPCTNAPYTVTVLDASDPAAVTLTIADRHGPLGTWGGPKDVLLVMSRVGNDWFIREMRMDPSPGPPVTVIVQ
jgi:hypothetical protein